MMHLENKLCTVINSLLSQYSLPNQLTSNANCKLQFYRNYAGKEECKDNGKLPKKLSLKNLDVAGQRVFMRVDFNVPMKDGKITNNERIVAALPSIKYVIEKEPKSLVLASHLGRPEGKKDLKYTLEPIAKELEKLLKKPVCFIDDCVGKVALDSLQDPPKGSVVLLENLRFYAEETGASKENKKEVKADPAKVKEFRVKLSKLGDVYVNDAFGTAHRAHSSMMGEGYKKRAAGFLLEKELTYFAKALDKPKKPFLAILGGAKIADKIPLINNLLNKVDQMIVAGGMAFTFHKVVNKMEIGKSLFDEKGSKTIPEIMKKASEKKVKIILPVDFLCAKSIKDSGEIKPADTKRGVPKDLMGLDVGEKSMQLFGSTIVQAKTIVWNGPPGLFENDKFAGGTRSMVDAVVCATKDGAISIVGGGDTATACKKFGASDKVSHVSTGGGAALELLEGKKLPGVAALTNAE